MIRIADDRLLSDQDLMDAIERYYHTQVTLDGGFHWSDPRWWQDRQLATVLVSSTQDRIDGFLIIGRGRLIDADVATEICELASFAGYGRLRRLIAAARPLLHAPWGFQVLKANERARRCFECLLAREGLSWRCQTGSEGRSQIVKYRIDPDGP